MKAGAEWKKLLTPAQYHICGKRGLRFLYGEVEYENRKGLIIVWDVMNLFFGRSKNMIQERDGQVLGANHSESFGVQRR